MRSSSPRGKGIRFCSVCVLLVVMTDSGPSSEGDKISISETQLRQMVAEATSNAVQEFIQRTGAPTGGGQTTAAPTTGIITHPFTPLACGTAFCLTLRVPRALFVHVHEQFPPNTVNVRYLR